VRAALVALVALIVVTVGFSRVAGAPEEATATGVVTSADHEIEEGYFTLGENVTVVAKPGTPLHDWLRERKGKKVTVTLQESATLLTLERSQR
jgi:hypothetical protein